NLVANGLAQGEIDRTGAEKIVTSGMPELLRRAAADGAVLLENDGVLPLRENTKIALFGVTGYESHYVGYGSGGDVNNPYEVSFSQGIENCDRLSLDAELAGKYKNWLEKNPINHGFWGHWPFHFPEMPLDIQSVKSARDSADVAVVVIGRSSGEDRDCKLKKGSWFIADDEDAMLRNVTAEFDRVILLLNIGGIMDMSILEKYKEKLGAVMIVWQGGMESGNAAADLLCGNVNPSGRLTDTIAKRYEDYPSSANFGGDDFNEYKEDIYVGYRYFETFAKEKVLYPFGYGIGYTDFEFEMLKAEKTDGGFEFNVKVKNIGNADGREVVQLYLRKPCGKLGNPEMCLVSFGKTETLKGGETEELKLSADMYQLSSYDEQASAYIIEKGRYEFFVGKNVRDCKSVCTFEQENDEIFSRCIQAAAPIEKFDVIKAEEKNGKRVAESRTVRPREYSLKNRILENFPKSVDRTGNVGIKLSDVKSGRSTMEQFVAQLDNDELEAISRGDYVMNSPLGTEGNAAVYGGVLESLRHKGVDPVTTTDGPSGIRLKASCSLMPIGTLFACSFDTQLVQEVYSAIAKEMKDRGSDVLLAPGMNIHRNPLCGRNFEYYSEDPYLMGKIAAAAVMGIQSQGGSACPKHFACNNQEKRRNMNDSRLSERALREIYLKGFEICIKEARPKNIMTSYNRINSVYGHYNYDLCTTILRGEWGYEGNVMTDWWMKSESSHEFPQIRDQAYRVRAQVDLLMPGGGRLNKRKPDGTLLETLGKADGITLGELQRTAANVLNSVINIKE
ncbi:MAG TPA: beta-glucosidase, partial [Ruminococcaceae bacterium]|nr:beta-glucosidase [Oscillospiraceae bacterium]